MFCLSLVVVQKSNSYCCTYFASFMEAERSTNSYECRDDNGWLAYIQKVYSIDEWEILQDQFDTYRSGVRRFSNELSKSHIANVNHHGGKDMGTMCPYYNC